VNLWKPYPAYKPSGVEWLGEIPAHWEVRRLKHVSRFAYGDSLASENREDGGVPVYGSNGQVGTHTLANTLAPVLIVGRKGSFGKVNFSNQPVFAIDTTYFIDVRSSKTNLRWLFYALPLLNLDQTSQDSAIPGLSRETAYANVLPIPAPSEQRAIAVFLDRETARLDALIAKHERLIELLQEKRAALISHAVTQGLDPSAPMKDSGVPWLGQIPAHWAEMKFRRVCQLQQGLQIAQSDRYAEPGPNRLEYITIKSIHAGAMADSKEYIENPSQRVICLPDDVLLARTGATGEVISGQYGAFHNNFFKVVYDRDLVEKDYLIYYLENSLIKQHLLLLAGTTTIPDLNHGEFLDTPFVAPPINEQVRIVASLDRETAKLDALIARVREGVEKLGEYRAALISAAGTGKMDVRSA
jgi:type I restriction enzyme S subunit